MDLFSDSSTVASEGGTIYSILYQSILLKQFAIPILLPTTVESRSTEDAMHYKNAQ